MMNLRLGYKNVTREEMYIYCNTEACLCNPCYSGKAVGIKYSECVSVFLP
jgi:hypothetical protein